MIADPAFAIKREVLQLIDLQNPQALRLRLPMR
jgi:hypothetical protein